MTDPFSPLVFPNGRSMANRLMLAPLTNLQSHLDGTLSDDEINWLTQRADGGFGLVMTAAAHVQAVGQGFRGQLGVFSDAHLPGLTRLARQIKSRGSLAAVQLHHAGMRSPADLIGQAPVSASADEKTGARALSTAEVQQLAEDFIAAAQRAQRAGFDGVELHGAHSYLIGQFLSAEFNQREDRYGGALENRCRLLLEIIDGVRERCGADFLIGVRLSPERFGILLDDAVATVQRLLAQGKLDFIDLSLWDARKEPAEPGKQGRSLMSYFAGLNRGKVRLGAAGKIYSGADVAYCLEHGMDFVLLGRAAILHHDFPQRLRADRGFHMVNPPVSRDYLRSEGLGPAFIDYMSTWQGFVAEQAAGN